MANNYNFVKFLRGSQAAYDRLASPDINTLYFIYDEESSEEQPSGKLYLGRYLINDSNLSSIALGDLVDTDIGTLTGTEILRYNSTLQKWQPVLASDLLAELDIEAGAAVVNSGITKEAGETDADALDRAVLTKKEGDLAIVDGTVYVYDDGDWLKIVDSSVTDIGNLADRVSALETALDDVYTKNETDSAIASAVATANHLTYTTVGSLENLDPTATNSQNKIFLVAKNPGSLNDGYDEYMAINNAWEKLGSWAVDLSNYVQTDDPRLLTTTQVGYINNLFDQNGQISVASISDLNTALANAQLIKSVDTNVFNVTAAGQLQLIDIPTSVLDLSDYVLKSVVGDLADLTNRSSADSTIVDELNALNDRLVWKPIENE